MEFFRLHKLLQAVHSKPCKVAKPLYTLISGENTSNTNKFTKWNEGCEQAFRKLKELCDVAPILAYMDFTTPFKLHTDACRLGLGTVLYQNSDGADRVICYDSRSLSQTEQKYPEHKFELFALKWAAMDRLHE